MTTCLPAVLAELPYLDKFLDCPYIVLEIISDRDWGQTVGTSSHVHG